MHDFAVLFDFNSCVTDIFSRLEPRRVIVLYFTFSFVRTISVNWTKLEWRGINQMLQIDKIK